LGHGRRGAAAVPLVPEDGPGRGRLKVAIDVAEPGDAGGRFIDAARIDPEHVEAPLRHDPEHGGGGRLDAVAEVQPLRVLFLAEPVADQLEQLRGVEREEFHRTRLAARKSAIRVRFRKSSISRSSTETRIPKVSSRGAGGSRTGRGSGVPGWKGS